jgi:hypothetical protein
MSMLHSLLDFASSRLTGICVESFQICRISFEVQGSAYLSPCLSPLSHFQTAKTREKLQNRRFIRDDVQPSISGLFCMSDMVGGLLFKALAPSERCLARKTAKRAMRTSQSIA